MSTPWKIEGDLILCFSDVHQRVNWAKAVLEHEKGNYDKVVFMGDIIDSHDSVPAVAGARETAKFYAGMLEQPNCYAVLGNHDAPVMESWAANSRFASKHHLIHSCSGFTNSKSIEFNKEMTWERWKKVNLFYLVNGVLVSHAGIRETFFRPHKTDEENLNLLWKDAREALDGIARLPHPLLACGIARGGSAPIAGCTWLDWLEFRDRLPYPQLVGHSFMENTVRQNGRSYCIDTGTAYALISRDGTITLKSLVGSRKLDVESGTNLENEFYWTEKEPRLRNDDKLIADFESFLDGAGRSGPIPLE